MSTSLTPTAVITGAAGGMGGALMESLLRLGYSVIGLDRKVAKLTEDHRALGAHFIQADLGVHDEAKRAIAEINERVDGVDLLINCAGSYRADKEIIDDPVKWAELWNDNVSSMAWCCLLLQPLLERSERQPLVINIASTDGVVASGGQDTEIGVSHDTLYAASKGGVIAFARALAMCWAPLRIRVNAICPTVARTPMSENLLATPGMEEQLAQHIPLRRVAELADITTAVASLIPLHMTTGHILTVDGGYLCS